jgi:hypothetical protein
LSLSFFPKTYPAANPVRVHYRFNDEVRIRGDARIGRVTGFREPTAGRPEIQVSFADRCSCWVAAHAVRFAKARLEVIDGGAA